MKRRVCDTCVFFERADIANSGWCNHPTRRSSTDVRLIVRQNELACRNGWDSDLWVARGANDNASAGVDDADDLFLNASGPVIPKPQDELTNVVPARSPQIIGRRPIDEAFSDDVVVHQSPAARVTPPDEPATKLVQDPKAAIQRAREQFRARRKDEGRLADRALGRPLIDPASGAPLATQPNVNFTDRKPTHPDGANRRDQARELDDGARYVDAPANQHPVHIPTSALERSTPINEGAQPRERAASSVEIPQESAVPVPSNTPSEVAPVSRNELYRPFPTMTSFPEDRDKFETIPEPIAQFDIPVASEAPLEAHQLSAGEELFDEYDLYEDEWDEDPDWDVVAEEDDAPVRDVRPRRRRRLSRLERFLAGRREASKRNQSSAIEYDDGYYEPELSFEESDALGYEIEDADEFGDDVADWDHVDEVEPVLVEASAQQGKAVLEPDHQVVADDDWRSRAEWSWPEPERSEIEARELPREDQLEEEPMPLHSEESVEDFSPDWRVPVRAERHRTVDEAEPVRVESDGMAQLDVLDDLFETSSLCLDTGQQQVPRTCRSCRDFRPAENGERGWCNNNWAFHHRRMVDADDLPCETSFGSWWLPHDDSWLKKADISRHGHPTPSFDRWLSDGHSRQFERVNTAASSPRRRRQS